MEADRGRDPGNLSPEDELAVLELDKHYRGTAAMIGSIAKEGALYFLSHQTAGTSDVNDPEYCPNHYMFFVSEQPMSDKVFVLFLSEETGNIVRVVNTAGVRALHKEELGLSDQELLTYPKLMDDFWNAVMVQGDLGATAPNDEDMEDFSNIVASWKYHAEITRGLIEQ